MGILPKKSLVASCATRGSKRAHRVRSGGRCDGTDRYGQLVASHLDQCARPALYFAREPGEPI